jgi:hypothetical protein
MKPYFCQVNNPVTRNPGGEVVMVKHRWDSLQSVSPPCNTPEQETLRQPDNLLRYVQNGTDTNSRRL